MTGKREKPLFLDMDFSEALERFTQAEPAEVQESIARAKKKRPPGDKPAGGKSASPARERKDGDDDR